MKKKVLLGLSGGVDSAVAAYLLKEQGYEVIPGFMKNYADPENPHCHTRKDRDSAKEVCNHLGLGGLQIFDFREEYNTRIVEYIFAEYGKGRTPNPDVLCNSLVKFDLFAQKAKDIGCDYVAMGHYARIFCDDDNTFKLLKGVDGNKDQSYFLSQLSQNQLSMSLFPLGDMTKDEVRNIANQINLPNANRPDSQGLCFIGDVSIKEFLSEKFPKTKGDVLDLEGEIVGSHEGAYFYTRGQRHGFQTPMKAYVVNTDIKMNTITVVSNRDDEGLFTNTFSVSDWHWVGKERRLPCSLGVKIRYRQMDCVDAFFDLKDGLLFCTLTESAWGVASGQFVVAYDGDQVVGSGVIEL